MKLKEHYYTEELTRGGLDGFIQHSEEYLGGARTEPVIRTYCFRDNDIFVQFSDTLFDKFVEDPIKGKKVVGATIKYGFRGTSKGGKNGIFAIRKEDGGLISKVRSLRDLHNPEMQERGMPIDVSNLKDVKIVYHSPSGERVVGVYNSDESKMFMLDYAFY